MKHQFAYGLVAALATTTPATGAIFFSEYVEGGSNNKALEIYNSSSSQFTFGSGDQIRLYNNGASTPNTTFDLSGETISGGGTLVIVNGGSTTALAAVGDIVSTGITSFNGDDAISLFVGNAVVDVIGQIGLDPGSAWSNSGVSTVNQTLVRKPSVLSGDPIGSDAFDPSVEWISFAQDTFSNLGAHTVIPEPATLALSGLGGLLLMRRWKGWGIVQAD